MKHNSYSKWLSVGFKMFVLYFVSMTIAVMVMGYLAYNKATEIIQSKVGNVALQTVQQASERLNTILEEYENRSMLIFGYRELQQAILGQSGDNYARTESTKQITNFISNLVNTRNDTVNIYILGEREASFRYESNQSPTVSELPPVLPVVRHTDWYRQVVAANGRVVWFGIRESFLDNSTAEHKPVFIFGRALKDVWGSGEIIGVMLYELDPEVIQNLLSEIDFNAHGSTIIVDQNKRVVADNGAGALKHVHGMNLPEGRSGISNAVLNGEEMLVVSEELAINGWKLVGMAPAKYLVKDSREIGLYTFCLAVVFMFVAVILAIVVARHVHNPVHTLLHSMRRAREGEFDTRISARRKDEFGILFENFNIMVSRIKSLIDELYFQRLLKKEMQLKMLASQINAHFIYNTLDSIHWLSRIHKVDEISTMIFGLSKYLRISLSSGKDKVTVREAVELVESYLSIQKTRYQDKFKVEMQVDPELLNYRVLKFVFQPLVENAIYHGLENKKGVGLLQIKWQKSENMLYFEVKDNGVGIPAEKMREIRESLNRNDMQEENFFALKNINSQIKLTYGQQYGLQIDSAEGIGTTVRMVLPLTEAKPKLPAKARRPAGVKDTTKKHTIHKNITL